MAHFFHVVKQAVSHVAMAICMLPYMELVERAFENERPTT